MFIAYFKELEKCKNHSSAPYAFHLTRGMLGEKRKLVNRESLGVKSVLSTALVVYCAIKNIERVICCFHEISMGTLFYTEENLLYLRDQVAYSYQIHGMTPQSNHID